MQFTRMFNVVETHSGIPMRVITGGVPPSRARPSTSRCE